MTESLFFSQLAAKSIDAQKTTHSASAKHFRSDASDFDKHLSLPERGDRRGRDSENIGGERREPTFAKKRRPDESNRSERAEVRNASQSAQEKRAERAERADRAEQSSNNKETASKAGQDTSRPRKSAEAQDNNKQAQNKTEGQTSSTQENGSAETEQLAETSTDEHALALIDAEIEEIALEDLVGLTGAAQETAIEPSETTAETTAQVIPLFTQNTEETEPQAKSPELVAANQPGVTILEGETSETAASATNKQAQAPTGQHPAAKILEAKQTGDGSKPGLETALAKIQETNKASGEVKPAVSAVAQVSKHASYLGDVNIEDAQKADKTEIKARISEMAQKVSAGSVSTSAVSKPAAMLSQQAGAAKIDGANPLQPMSSDVHLTTHQNSHAVHVRFGSLPQATQNAQIPVTTIAFHIAKSVENGVNRFEIRIDPPELGRVDVKLEVGKSGRVIANLTVERPETLDLLQRDQRALERALEDAGLDVGGQSLNFSLKDQNADNSESSDLGASQIAANTELEEDLIEPEMLTGYVTNSGVDIRI